LRPDMYVCVSNLLAIEVVALGKINHGTYITLSPLLPGHLNLFLL